MADVTALRTLLRRIDGRGYGAWKELVGTWEMPGFALTVEKVQSDPFAPPTRLAVTVPAARAGLPPALTETPDRRRGLRDHLGRLVRARLADTGAPFRVDAGGQEVLDRTTTRIDDDGSVTVRCAVSLPDKRRRVRAERVARWLCEDLPEAVDDTLRWEAIDQDAARRFVATVEDAATLRAHLPELGLVAFVADGALLPRRSGIDDRPLDAAAVPFTAPEGLRLTVTLPNAGEITGMGVGEGVTLIVGGGFHGKSTLLRALERGVYDHVPGDGRELVVTRADAVKIRAEDGRRVARVDISAFVGDLPTGADTADFSTENASGSTSQAANIVEALEVGARVLLIDEDTSATNLMIRDHRMQELVAKDREPLTPFVDLATPLHRDRGTSTVLVVGGSGDYFDVADRVVCMDAFVPRLVTEEARTIARRHPGRIAEAQQFPPVRPRVPDPASIDPRRRGRVKTKARGLDALGFGHETIDLAAVEQLVDPSQTAGVAAALVRLVDDGVLDGERTLAVALDRLDADLAGGGIAALRGGYPGDLAMPRRFEIAAALNRLRTLRVLG